MLIANKISKKKNDNIPEDFGILLTKDNINQYLKQQIKIYDLNKILKKGK
jgi:hypothetical protein